MPNRNRSFAQRKIFKLPILQFVGLAALVVLLIVTVVGAMAGGTFDIRNYAKGKNQIRPNCSEKCVEGTKYEYNKKTNTCIKKKCGGTTPAPQNCTSIKGSSACGKAADCKWIACANKCMPKSYGPDTGDLCYPCSKITNRTDCVSADYCSWTPEGKCIQ